MNILKKLVGETAIYGLSSVVGRLLNYLLVPLYTDVFLPGDYGIVTEIYAYVAFLVILLTYGLETAFFRFSKKDGKTKYVYSTALISLITSSIVFVILMFTSSSGIASWIGSPENPEYVQWFALIVALDAISSISFAKLRAQNKAIRFTLIRVISIFVNVGLNLYFIVYQQNHEIQYIFIANLIASIITIVLLSPEMLDSSWRFDKVLWKKMMLYALPLLVAGFAGITNEAIDRILLKKIEQPTVIYDGYLEKIKQQILYFEKQQPKLDSLSYKKIKKLKEANSSIYEDIIACKKTFKNLPNKSKEYIIMEAKNTELGLYGAFYKLSILMTLFIQTFRYAAEPFFFTQEKTKNSRKTYADVMKYFTVIMAIIFLVVIIFYDFIQGIFILGSEYHDERGFLVVSILLLANLFLGIYYNLSIWYKLTDKTKYGAYLSVFGATITLALNIALIPIFGFLGAAWATLVCYFSMTMASYFIGRRHFFVPYQLRRIGLYLSIMLGIYLIIYVSRKTEEINLWVNLLYLAGFIILMAYQMI